MQKRYYLCCPIFNIYDIVYFMKLIANAKSHTEAYGRATSNATRCISGVYPPPPLTFIYTSEATTYTAGSTRRAAFDVSSAVWRGQTGKNLLRTNNIIIIN